MKNLKGKPNKNEQGMAVVFVLFLTLILTLVTATLLFRVPLEKGGTVYQKESTKALYVAESGLTEAIVRLQIDPNWSTWYPIWNPINIPLRENPADPSSPLIGTYTVNLRALSLLTNPNRADAYRQTVEITAIGTSGKGAKRTIVADVVTDNPAEYFIATQTSLNVGSGAYITGKLYAKDIDFWVYGTPPNNTITITDAVIYYSNYDPNYLNNHKHNDTNPSAIILPSGEPHHEEKKVLPILNELRMKEKAQYVGTVQELPGGSTLTGDLKLEDGTIPSSQLIYVDGDLTIQNVRIYDQVTIIATGDIYIKGDILYATLDPKRQGIGILSKKNIIIDPLSPNDITINGLFIAQEGRFYTVGDPGSKSGTLTFSGSIVAKDGVVLNTYANRVLSYDANLKVNSLPHVTFMAQILRWKEI